MLRGVLVAAYDDSNIRGFFLFLFQKVTPSPSVDFVSLQYPADPDDAQSCISSTQFCVG
jgi:hypothetical protein